MRKFILNICATVLCLYCAGAVSAQDIRSLDAGAIQQRSGETFERFRFEEDIESREEVPEDIVEGEGDEAAPTDAGPPETTFFLDKVVIGRSKILSDDELTAITSGYEKRQVSISELLGMVGEINALYSEKKAVTAKAFLTPQRVEGGVVEITLVESVVGEVRVEGAEYTSKAYITDRVGLGEGELLMAGRLEEDLIFFNSVNGLTTRAELVKGERFGTTDVVLRIDEPKNYTAAIYADNAGQKGVGRERVGLMCTALSLFGYRDTLSIGGNYADGTLAGHVSYNFPVSGYGTRVGAYYDYNQIEINSGPLATLNITGDSQDIGAFVSHPFVADRTDKLDGFLRANMKSSETRFEGVKLFDNEVRSLALGLNFQRKDAGGFWYAGNALTKGFDILGGDTDFLKYNMDFVARGPVWRGSSVLFRIGGQWSDTDLLPPSEQFQIGGMATVRGYSEGLLIGDSGYSMSAEIDFPLRFLDWEIKGYSLRDKIRGAVFVDHGGVFPYKGPGGSITHDDFLVGAGFGTLFRITDYLGGRVYCGFPIGERESDQNSARLHFYVQTVLP